MVETRQLLAKTAVRALGADPVRRPAVRDLPPGTSRMSDSEVVRVGFELAARQYGLPIPAANIQMTRLEHAGRIHRRDGVWYIEINSTRRYDRWELLSIVAHETAHIILHDRRVSLGSAQMDELLTDSVAVLAGFGEVMLEANHRVSVLGSITVTSKLGYLDRSTIKWLHRLREAIASDKPRRRFSPHYLAISQNTACPGCGQGLRLPSREGRIRARCPSCGLRQEVVLRHSPESRWTLKGLLFDGLVRSVDVLRGFDVPPPVT